MWKSVASAAFAIAVAGGCYWSLWGVDVASSSYPSYAAAEAAGLFGRGWIPTYIPRSAFSLSESHNLDSNEVCAAFSLPDTDHEGFVAALTDAGFRRSDAAPVQPPSLSPLHSCPFAVPPSDARVVVSRRSQTRLVEVFALFSESNEVYYWSSRR